MTDFIRFTVEDLAALHAASTQGEWLTDAWVTSAEAFGIRISAIDSAFIAAAHDLVPQIIAERDAALAQRDTLEAALREWIEADDEESALCSVGAYEDDARVVAAGGRLRAALRAVSAEEQPA